MLQGSVQGGRLQGGVKAEPRAGARTYGAALALNRASLAGRIREKPPSPSLICAKGSSTLFLGAAEDPRDNTRSPLEANSRRNEGATLNLGRIPHDPSYENLA